MVERRGEKRNLNESDGEIHDKRRSESEREGEALKHALAKLTRYHIS